MHFKTEID
jgi:hypothetical protein